MSARRPGSGAPDGVCRWAVVGCGWVARDHFVPGVRASAAGAWGRARVVAAVDRDADAAAAVSRAAGGVPVHRDTAALLARGGADAVYVATPNHAHREVVEAAAGAGLAVLCEKPLAAGVADAAAVADACGRAGVVAGTAFDQRFHPAHRVARRLVRAGRLGRVTAVRIVYGCWLPPEWSPPGERAGGYDNWRADPARAGGGAVLDLAPHVLDLAGEVLGRDTVRLSVVPQRRVHRYPVDDGGLLTAVTGDGVLVSAHVSYNTRERLPRRRLEIVGTDGQLTATDTMGQEAGGRLELRDAAGRVTEVPFDAVTSPFTAQVRAFSAAVMAGPADTGRRWAWPLERDLMLHRMLLAALAEAERPAERAGHGHHVLESEGTSP
ncbi:Gfo/Idh/MocA family protein [Streptomyces sp. NPDC058459]|uniref:Gfo/Idh/MocA family protein n=1 Tax=Streptomyces sp. NPDC058459 TaxID=3346508 RepID=UPI00365D5290